MKNISTIELMRAQENKKFERESERKSRRKKHRKLIIKRERGKREKRDRV